MAEFKGLTECIKKAREILDSLHKEGYATIEVATIVNVMDKEVQGTVIMNELEIRKGAEE